LNLGFGTMIPPEAIRIILQPRSPNFEVKNPSFSAPLKRLVDRAREEGRLIQAEHGRKVRAVIITDSNHVVFSALSAETLFARLQESRKKG
jgi:regulator of extracellular matrix RemA (YlzA/DUF370 family)